MTDRNRGQKQSERKRWIGTEEPAQKHRDGNSERGTGRVTDKQQQG